MKAPSSSAPIIVGTIGSRLDWSRLKARWERVFSSTFSDPVLLGVPIALSKAECRALGFLYASGDKTPPRVDLNQ